MIKTVRDNYWWDLRKTAFFVELVVEEDWQTLFATDFEVQKGPPYAIRFSLEKNLRTRSPGVGTAIDAAALVSGGFSRLRRVIVRDEYVLKGMRRSLANTEDTSVPWLMTIVLKGRHSFKVRPSYDPERKSLELHVIEALVAHAV